MFRSHLHTRDLISPRAPAAGAADDDAPLVAAARSDPRAFGALYERYLNPVYGYCYVRLGSREAAEDATGEVFMKALAGLDGYRGGLFAAWLFRIARNVVIDTQRRQRHTGPLPVASDPVDPARGPEDIAVARADQAALRAALAALPDSQRTALELQLAGWSGAEIAGALGKTPAAVKMLRLRALAELRARLRPGALEGDPR